MLKHMKMDVKGDVIEKAVLKTISEGKILTGDLRGSAKCSEFTAEVIKNLMKV